MSADNAPTPAAHAIQAFVGLPQVLMTFRAVLPDVRAYYLRPASRYAVLPFDDLLRDALHAAHGTGEWAADSAVALSSSDLAFAAAASQRGPLAYLETDYDGPDGAQAACLWIGGALALRPARADWMALQRRPPSTWPINAALSGLGLKAGPGDDETEVLGLMYYASNADIALRALAVTP